MTACHLNRQIIYVIFILHLNKKPTTRQRLLFTSSYSSVFLALKMMSCYIINGKTNGIYLFVTTKRHIKGKSHFKVKLQQIIQQTTILLLKPFRNVPIIFKCVSGVFNKLSLHFPVPKII